MEDFINPNFIFYEDGDPACFELEETLSLLQNCEDEADAMQLTRILVSFASEFGLSGNLRSQWMAYMLMMHENAFTLACERRRIDDDSTIMKLAQNDLKTIREILQGRRAEAPGGTNDILNMLRDYKEPYKADSEGGAGRRIKQLSDRLEAAATLPEFSDAVREYHENYGVGKYGLYKAFRISSEYDETEIVPVTDTEDICFDVLIGCEEQTKILRENTEAFIAGLPANNVLLYGDSGTGKSTSVHALMHDYYDKGLRLIEISKADRKFIPEVLAGIKKRNYKFILFLDDLSFEENESDYKDLKAMLEGALETANENIIIYATSNRRYLIRETWKDRSDMEYDQDVHRSDTMEEKLSLASRFGVNIYYPKPGPKEYLKIVKKLAERKGLDTGEKELEDLARKWELRHGGMSGRAASQLITWLSRSTQ